MTKQQEVEMQCRRAAGWDKGRWPQRERHDGVKFDYPNPVRIRMHHGEIVTTGWENAARSILMGVATLVTDPA
jgi:hypothetical protein